MAKKHAITTTSSGFSERQLTPGERALARQVFGPDIKYDQVKISEKLWPGPLSEDFAAGSAHHMWVFMFEMAQVWLDQNAKNHSTDAPVMPIWDTLSRWLRDNPHAGYSHNLDVAKRLLAYMAEQRADSELEYFIRKYKRGALTKDERLALYEHMLAESHHAHHVHEAYELVPILGSLAALDFDALGSSLTPGSPAAALGAAALDSTNTLGFGASVLGANALAMGPNPAVGSDIVGLGLSAAEPSKINVPKDAFPLSELPEAEKRTYLPREIWLKNGFAPIDEEKGRWLVVKDSQNQDQTIYMYSAKSVVAVKPEDQRSSVDVAREIYLKMAQDQLMETRLLVPEQHTGPSHKELSPDR